MAVTVNWVPLPDVPLATTKPTKLMPRKQTRNNRTRHEHGSCVGDHTTFRGKTRGRSWAHFPFIWKRQYVDLHYNHVTALVWCLGATYIFLELLC